MIHSIDDKISLLKEAFATGLAAVRAENFMGDVVRAVQSEAQGRKIYVLGFGKAAGAMVSAYFAAGGSSESALVIMPDSVVSDCADKAPCALRICYSAHPVPDETSEEAARAALAMAQGLTESDLFVVLISGGGSSLMSLGLDEISLAEKQQVNQALLDSGMAIQQVNIIRKHLSAIKGGRLALAAAPAKVMSFALSDVPGDEPSSIASGPTVGDETNRQMALSILQNCQIKVPPAVTKLLSSDICETPLHSDSRLSANEFTIIASATTALRAAASCLEKQGYQTVIMGDKFQQDTVALADIMVSKLAELPEGSALISGGEASVAVRGDGIGGRNAQFALEMAMRDMPDICGLSCDTDGIDGAKANAGAVFYHGMTDHAAEQGIDIASYYERYDSHSFFEQLDCHIVTGPTQTNVNDLRILLKGAPQKSR
ncbi:MAG: glycerate kinase type-2 family protein [Candidatus Puniceispirillaceae bacterium]